jgi:hypothetical protein
VSPDTRLDETRLEIESVTGLESVVFGDLAIDLVHVVIGRAYVFTVFQDIAAGRM